MRTKETVGIQKGFVGGADRKGIDDKRNKCQGPVGVMKYHNGVRNRTLVEH